MAKKPIVTVQPKENDNKKHKPCCSKERRSINGGCKSCGDPSF